MSYLHARLALDDVGTGFGGCNPPRRAGHGTHAHLARPEQRRVGRRLVSEESHSAGQSGQAQWSLRFCRASWVALHTYETEYGCIRWTLIFVFVIDT